MKSKLKYVSIVIGSLLAATVAMSAYASGGHDKNAPDLDEHASVPDKDGGH